MLISSFGILYEIKKWSLMVVVFWGSYGFLWAFGCFLDFSANAVMPSILEY